MAYVITNMSSPITRRAVRTLEEAYSFVIDAGCEGFAGELPGSVVTPDGLTIKVEFFNAFELLGLHPSRADAVAVTAFNEAERGITVGAGCAECTGLGTADHVYDDPEIGGYVIGQECEACDGTGQARAVLRAIQRLKAKWRAPIHSDDVQASNAAWAAVGSEAHKLACDALNEGRL